MNKRDSFLFTIFLLSCSKSAKNSTDPAFYGKWQFNGSAFGPTNTIPSIDSVVILSLKSDHTYSVSMNGNITIQGSFTIETNSNFLTLKFLNIDQPYGNNTSGSSNGINYVSFNTAKIGQLVLFQENSTSAPGDILSLLSYPITPEATTNIFKRLN